MRSKVIVVFLLFMSASVVSETIKSGVLVTYSKPVVRIVDDSPPLSVTVYEDGNAVIFVPHYMKQSGSHYTRLTKGELLLLKAGRDTTSAHSTSSHTSVNVEKLLNANNIKSKQVMSSNAGVYSKPEYADISYAGDPSLDIELSGIGHLDTEHTFKTDQNSAGLLEVVVLLERVIRSRGHYEDL